MKPAGIEVCLRYQKTFADLSHVRATKKSLLSEFMVLIAVDSIKIYTYIKSISQS